MKNIYTVLEEIKFEKEIEDYVKRCKIHPEIAQEKFLVQNFVFGILQKFYENILEEK